MKPARLNLDANATLGIRVEVWSALERLRSDEFLNPSSVHQGGQKSRALIEEARAAIADLLDLDSEDRIIFTSGATEANNTALFAPFWEWLSAPNQTEKPKLVTTALEHPSVLEPAERLEKLGVSVTRVSPRSLDGITSTDFLAQVSQNTTLVSFMLANNETGHVFPVKEISSAIRAKFPNVLIHSDAVQALGRMPLSFRELGVDLLSLSGHKAGALPGIGVLVVKGGVNIQPLLTGGPQETRNRAGTENLLGIYSFGVVAALLKNELAREIQALTRTRDALRNCLSELVSEISFNTPTTNVLPNTLSLTVSGVRTDDLVVALDLEGIAVSSGSACASGKPEPSHVLHAFGLSEDVARQTIRISIRPDLTPAAAEDAARTISRVVARARKW